LGCLLHIHDEHYYYSKGGAIKIKITRFFL
jgi:hypothetical protein